MERARRWDGPTGARGAGTAPPSAPVGSVHERTGRGDATVAAGAYSEGDPNR